MTIEERLERLERKCRRLKLAVAALVAAAAVGALVAAKAGTPRFPAAQEGEVKDELRARKFLLMDETGKERASLVVDKDGPALRLVDENGKVRVALLALKDGTGLTLEGLPTHWQVSAMGR